MVDYFDKHSTVWDKNRHRVERAQTIVNAIKATIPFTKAERALDFGCGTGLLGLDLADSVGEIWLGDTSEGMLSELRKKIQAQQIKNAIPIHLDQDEHPQSYDVIASLMVLHHIDDVAAQIRTLVSWLTQGGYLCLCDLDKEDGSFHEEEQVPHHGLDREFITACLEENQLEVVSNTTVYINKKVVDNVEKEYPIFMIVGRKIVECD